MIDVIEIDAQTGEAVERDYTEAETAQRAKDAAKYKELAKTRTERATAKAALLDKLGITADEAALLLG